MLKQFGYQTEPVFRNDELLVNAGEPGIGLLKNSRELTLTDTLYALTPELLFDYLGVSLNSEKSKGKNWLSTGLPKTEDHTASGLKTKC